MAIDDKKAYQHEYYLRNKKKISAQQKEYYVRNKERIIEYQKEYAQKNIEKIKIKRIEYYKKYKLEGKYRLYASEYKKRQRESDEAELKKIFARACVASALKRGLLKKKPCEACGAAEVHAHHVNYSDPLCVKWLCIKHHREHHSKLKLKKHVK